MNENEFSTFEGRAYLNPTTSRDERLQFIDTLHEVQNKNNQEIISDTYALGSQLPSNMGGLSGAESEFIAKYQTPQTNQTVANLRAAAQQSALNTALSNLQNAYKKRYNDAMLAYQRRSSSSSGSSSPSGSVTIREPDYSGLLGSSITGGGAGSTVVKPDGTVGVFGTDENGNPVGGDNVTVPSTTGNTTSVTNAPLTVSNSPFLNSLIQGVEFINPGNYLLQLLRGGK